MGVRWNLKFRFYPDVNAQRFTVQNLHSTCVSRAEMNSNGTGFYRINHIQPRGLGIQLSKEDSSQAGRNATQALHADYFVAYRSLKLARDANGVVVVELHSNGGPCTFSALHRLVQSEYEVGSETQKQ